MPTRYLFHLGVAVAALLVMMSARDIVEPASAGPTVTVYQSPT